MTKAKMPTNIDAPLSFEIRQVSFEFEDKPGFSIADHNSESFLLTLFRETMLELRLQKRNFDPHF